MFREVPLSSTNQVAPLNFLFDTEKRIRDKHIYDKTIMMDFEYVQLPVPAGYHQYLSSRYGDYMTPQNIPNTHGEVIFDVETPYDEYLKRIHAK